MSQKKKIWLWIWAGFWVLAGVNHFRDPDFYLTIMPPYLPMHRELVYLSGVFEILGGIGLLVPNRRVWAAWGLIALLVAVFPANLHMAMNDVPFEGEHLSPVLLWGRLPVQGLMIALTYWFTRPDR